MAKILVFLGLLVYSFVVEVLFAGLLLLSLVAPALRRGVRGRHFCGFDGKKIQEYLSGFRECHLFFCSSAGEYEQAKPVMNALIKKEGVGVFLLFFSPSGVEFARARGESCFFMLAPPDSLLRWWPLFRILKAKSTVVVRYELWPAFLWVAKRYTRTFLIDAVPSESAQSSFLKSYATALLLRAFDTIYGVSKKDLPYFSKLAVPSSKLEMVGDTKYDRVMEYKNLCLAKENKTFPRLFGDAKIMIIGSGWQKDIQLLGSFFANDHDYLAAWRLVVAPHDVSGQMVGWVKEVLEGYGLSVQLYSELEDSVVLAAKTVLVVDQIGLLSSLYGYGHGAFVGGGLHHRVHNVLEPASFGLDIAFGPKHTTSKEALALVEAGLCSVISDEQHLESWWRQIAAQPQFQKEKILKWLDNLCGASHKITEKLSQIGKSAP